MLIHTVKFRLANWMELTQELSQSDRFDAQWQAIERREQKTLKELNHRHRTKCWRLHPY